MKTLGIIITLANVVCLMVGILDIAIIDIPIIHGSVAQVCVSYIGTLCGCAVICSKL